MSKIGKRPIKVTTATIKIDGSTVVIQGVHGGSVEHVVPLNFVVTFEDQLLTIKPSRVVRSTNREWGLHRALLANKVIGMETGFSKDVKIVGLGFKAQAVERKLVFTLGYSHRKEYLLPEGVTVDIDKTGQLLSVKSRDKFSLGNVCDGIRSLRKPEPYKATGIIVGNEVIIRKAGKTKR